MNRKVYLSNFYVLGAEAVQKSQPKKQDQVPEPQESANWKYDENMSQFYLTSD